METFDFFGKKLTYIQQQCDGTKNGPFCHIGERTIEVPIAREWIKEFPPDLEVGAVMPYFCAPGCTKPMHLCYQPVPWPVIDLTDDYSASIRQCASTIDYHNKNLLCISTVEHIGYGDYGLAIDLSLAITVFEKMIAEAKNYLISIPIGSNKLLDAHVCSSKYPRFIYKQIDGYNHWMIAEDNAASWQLLYDSVYPYANAVVFVTNWHL